MGWDGTKCICHKALLARLRIFGVLLRVLPIGTISVCVDTYSWATERDSFSLVAQSVSGSIVAYGYLPVAEGKLEDHDF